MSYVILIRMQDDKLQAVSNSDMEYGEEWIYEYESEEEALDFTKNSALLQVVLWEIVEVKV